jgi:Methionyl-tRNA formyltransferase
MDAGDILNYKICPIDKNDTQDSLFEKLAQCGKDILIKTLDDIENGTVKYFPQNRIKYNNSNKTFVKPTYCRKITKQDELINWNKSAQKIHNQIRALSSNPTAYTILNGMIFKIYRSEVVENRSKNNSGEVIAFEKDGIIVGCEAGKIRIIEGCFQGGKRLYARDIINGKKIKIGDRFSIL